MRTMNREVFLIVGTLVFFGFARAAGAADSAQAYRWKSKSGTFPAQMAGQGFTIKGTQITVPKGASIPITTHTGLIGVASPNDQPLVFTVPEKAEASSDKSMPDLAGSRNVRIEVDASTGPTVYAGLAFAQPCVVEITADGIVLVDKEGITAKESGEKVWTSRKTSLNSKEVIAFFTE